MGGGDGDAPPGSTGRSGARDNVAASFQQHRGDTERGKGVAHAIEDPTLGDTTEVQPCAGKAESNGASAAVQLDASKADGGSRGRHNLRRWLDSGPTLVAPQRRDCTDRGIEGAVACRSNRHCASEHLKEFVTDGNRSSQRMHLKATHLARWPPITENVLEHRNAIEGEPGCHPSLGGIRVKDKANLKPHVQLTEFVGGDLCGDRGRRQEREAEECPPRHIASMRHHLRNLAILGILGATPGWAPAQTGVVEDSVAGMGIKWRMVPVDAGRVEVAGGDGTVTVDVAAFLIGQTEVTWDMYDVFLLRLDLPREERPLVAASARPSRPYGAPDAGFGHRGYPVISVTHDAATRFAQWLSARTGRQYLVASDAQWTLAARAAFPDSIRPTTVAWTAANADGSTHPVATLAPDALGTYDLLGNAGEWVTGHDGSPWLRGGTFADSPDSVSPGWRARQQPAWNQTDPQVPKSRWWLSDGPFAGFRLVRIP